MDNALSTNGPEVIVSLKLTFRADAIDHVIETFRPAIALTRAEPGNNDFQFFKVANSDDTFIIFERWKNQAALDSHWQQPHTQKIFALFEEYLVKPFSEADDVTYLADVAA